jgi:hypothetical protein
MRGAFLVDLVEASADAPLPRGVIGILGWLNYERRGIDF